MPEEIYVLKTHLAYQTSFVSSVLIVLMALILLIIYQTVRKKQLAPDDPYLLESKHIFVMIAFFTVFVMTRPFSYTLGDPNAAGWNMRLHIYAAFFGIYHFLKLIYIYSHETKKKYATVIPLVFLIYTIIYILVASTTDLLIHKPLHFDQYGWTIEYGPLFNFGFGIPFFITITYGMVKLIKAAKSFRSSALERSRYILIVTAMSIMIVGSIFEVLKVFIKLTTNIGDTAVFGACFLSLFIGLSSIIQFYQIQVKNQKSEEELLQVFNKLNSTMDQGKETLSQFNPAVDKIHRLSVDLNDFVTLTQNRANDAYDKANKQKDHVKNFSTMVISNITTFEDIMKSMNEQKVKIEEFKKIIEAINLLLTNISENGKIVSGGVVNLNSVINDAKIHSDSNYKLINEVKVSINKIIQVTQAIDRVSEDSNVLSMNASIESATSGDIGTGFKVVANDLRTMSIMTNNETSKIKDIIRLLQSDLDVGFSSANHVKSFFTNLEKTIERVFNFIMTIIQNSNQLIEKIVSVNTTIDSLLSIADESLEKGEQQQRLNNELNESIVSMKYMIESIRRAMSETLNIVSTVFDFSQYLQDNSVKYQVKSSELFKVIDHIDSSINMEHSNDD